MGAVIVMRTSTGEQRIIDILLGEELTFKREYTFPDLRTLRRGVPRYDFVIFNEDGEIDYIVEFDGEQHFKAVMGSTRDFQYRAQTDRLKNQYCLLNDIALYRIPYTDINLLKNSASLKTSRYRVKTKWHNDNLRFKNILPKI